MNVLVLEASTTSAKAMIYSDNAGIVQLVSIPYPDTVRQGANLEATGIFEAITAVGRTVVDRFETSGQSIDIVVIVSIWHSLLVCRNQVPQTPVYTWADTSGTAIAARIREDRAQTADLYHRTGCMPHAIYPAYRLMYLQETGLQLAGCQVTDLGGYLLTRLTGAYATSVNMASGTGLLDIRTRRWDPDMLSLAGVRQDQLPALFPDRGSFPLTAQAAGRLGLAPGTPVTLPYADGMMNQVGAGALQPARLTISVGTSCAIRTVVDQMPDLRLDSGLWCYCTPMVDRWLAGAATSGGTNTLDWFRRKLGAGRSLQELDQLAHVAPDLPVFLPFLYGERCPGWNEARRATFSGLQPEHDIGDLYSAVLEGVLFTVRQCFEKLAAVTPIQHVNLSGGILKSAVWSQMAADMLQQPLELSPSEQASVLGGAAMGLYVAGALSDLADFGGEIARVIRPDETRKAYYEQRYQRYLQVYQSGSM